MASDPAAAAPPLDVRAVLRLWWPLAASWLLMGCELPAVSAVMARLPHATVSLAAYGGVVFPLALLLESPIIMLLSASTALCRDWQSYRVVRGYMLIAGGATTALHALLAFTPLFDWVIGGVLRPPAEVLGPARIGLRLMLPWTLSIAFRRTQQGVLIRAGRSHAVGIGTAVRLGANCLVLGAGWVVGHVPGIVVGTLAVSAGVLSEAAYAGLAVRPVLRRQVRLAPPAPTPLTAAAFLRFFAPLVLTPLILFLAGPVATGGISRMPLALQSLAAWPVANGLVFVLRSSGIALNEVVVALLERPRALPVLRRVCLAMAAATTAVLAAVAATPLAHLWFAGVSGLAPELDALAGAGLWFALLLPGLSALQSYYQGALLHVHRTRAITESVVVYVGLCTAALVAGVAAQRLCGLYVAAAAVTLGTAGQVAWLRARAAVHLRDIARRGPQFGAHADAPWPADVPA
ncbi:MAG TPA: hypothetical protein VMS93_07195 [Candidatus Saccharimonadales bacterium]|nr:hypothetical protein [Candidatus Saccharimonadales bacterium]